MKLLPSSLILITATLGLAACDKQQPPPPPVDTTSFQMISAKISVGTNQIDSVIEWNTKTGDTRLLSTAVLTDKNSGQSAPVIGWTGVQDFQQAFQNVASHMQAGKASASPSPSSTPIQPKEDKND